MIKKKKKLIRIGIAHITSTFRNTIITITDIFGNTLCWSSSGSLGFLGSRKATAFAIQSATKNALLKAIEFGIEKLEIIIKGCGEERESCISCFQISGLQVVSIEDKTGIPHNGCRPPKKRKL
jgi:small subunit ribosomal protein S11